MPVEKKPKLYSVLVKWFVLTGLIAALLSVGINTVQTYRSLRDFACLKLTTSRNQQALFLENWFTQRKQDIQQLSSNGVLKEKEASRIREVFEGYLENSCFDTYFFADLKGNVLVSTSQGEENLYVRDRKYFLEAVQGKKGVSEVVESRKNGFPTVIFASPVYAEDEVPCGVVFGEVRLTWLNDLIASFNFGQTGETYLVDKRGVMLTESRFTPLLVGKGLIKDTTVYSLNASSPGVIRAVNGETGFMEYKNYRGSNVLGSYCLLPGPGWGLVVEMEKNEILRSLFGQVSGSLMLILLVMVIVVVPLSWHLAQKTVIPLTRLTERINAFTENYKSDVLSWAALDIPVYKEIAKLSQSFYTMGEKIGQLMENMEIQSEHDALTGLANRHSFAKRGGQLIELMQRTGRVCSLIFLDIDRFKSINDTYGHTAGDSVLIKLGEILEKNVRISDVAGRFGGEEFTILLPDTSQEGARMLAERLRKRIEQTTILTAGGEVFITVSMGIAVYQGGKGRINTQEVLERLIYKADKAMYKAKENGRNRIEIYEDEEIAKQLKIFI